MTRNTIDNRYSRARGGYREYFHAQVLLDLKLKLNTSRLCGSVGLGLGSHQVQRGAGLEPLDLALVEGMCELNILQT